jgi:hypothetical protein
MKRKKKENGQQRSQESAQVVADALEAEGPPSVFVGH